MVSTMDAHHTSCGRGQSGEQSPNFGLFCLLPPSSLPEMNSRTEASLLRAACPCLILAYMYNNIDMGPLFQETGSSGCSVVVLIIAFSLKIN